MQVAFHTVVYQNPPFFGAVPKESRKSKGREQETRPESKPQAPGRKQSRPNGFAFTPITSVYRDPLNPNAIGNTFEELAKISSPSGREARVRQYLIRQFEALRSRHPSITWQVVQGEHLLLTIPAYKNRSHQNLLVTTHMDTVIPCNEVRPKRTVTDTDTLYTATNDNVLGADDKAAIASLLHGILYNLENKQLSRPKTYYLFTTREEAAKQGALGIPKKVFKDLKPDFGIAFDMEGNPDGTYAYSAPGYLKFWFTLLGKSAHAGFSPDKAANALAALAHVLTYRNYPSGIVNPFVRVNTVLPDGQTFSLNTVPGKASAVGEIRFLDPKAVKPVLDTIGTALDYGVGLVPGTRSTGLRKQVYLKPYTTPAETPGRGCVERALRTMGFPIKPVETWGASDANVLSQYFPCVVLPAAYLHPHEPNRERASLRGMVTNARLLSALLQEFAQVA